MLASFLEILASGFERAATLQRSMRITQPSIKRWPERTSVPATTRAAPIKIAHITASAILGDPYMANPDPDLIVPYLYR